MVIRQSAVRRARGVPSTLLCTVMLALAPGLSQQVNAAPIMYTLTVSPVSGSLGSTAFSQAVMLLTFQGDSSSTVPFSFPKASGYVNLVGAASVAILQTYNGPVTAQGTFLPSAGIYIGVDNTNSGIGFGSLGVPPTTPGFPGQPAYPASVLTTDARIGTYDLQSDYSPDVLNSWFYICVNFPSPNGCANPIALPTTSGNLVLNTVQGGYYPIFTAESLVPQIFDLLLD